MSGFVCPVCGLPLDRTEKSYTCAGNHCYDISKSGYVNLLLSQKGGNHGDDKIMVKARRDFLEKGYYNALRDKITDTVKKYASDGAVILDAGCGECFYTSHFYEELVREGIKAEVLALDISKNALAAAKSRSKGIEKAVASIFHMPVADSSCDIIVNVFAPFCREEFLRVLKPGGIYIQTIPLEEHLFELKEIVYDNPYKNQVEPYRIDGFELAKSSELRRKVVLQTTDDIKALFMMTPYYYRTSEKDFAKLDSVASLKVSTEFAVLAFRKK
ncbi:MAG: methyltransferase domain-containing protein [Oscillospiraceae bacterium]|nr:methyltransferase domain-containing protein [Oscillospiraceae bacterium]